MIFKINFFKMFLSMLETMMVVYLTISLAATFHPATDNEDLTSDLTDDSATSTLAFQKQPFKKQTTKHSSNETTEMSTRLASALAEGYEFPYDKESTASFSGQSKNSSDIRFLDMPESFVLLKSKLRINFTSSTRGYIQNRPKKQVSKTNSIFSGFFLDKQRDTSVVRVPEGYSLIVSVPRIKMDIQSDCDTDDGLVLRVDESLVWTTCKTYHPPATFHMGAHNFTVGFYSKRSFSTGATSANFEVRFSFHKTSAVPEMLPSGLWNCSTPLWAEFRDHLECNLNTECAGGEDEVDCSFHSPVCQAGQLFVAGSCYSYIQPNESLTWDQASDVCQSEGAQLLSLNTEEEWRAVSGLLSMFNFGGIFLGLSGRNPVQQNAYRNILTWSDNTKAYFRYIDKSSSSAPHYYILQSHINLDLDVFEAVARSTTPQITLIDPFEVKITYLEEMENLHSYVMNFKNPQNITNSSHVAKAEEDEERENDKFFVNIMCEFDVKERATSHAERHAESVIELSDVISTPFPFPTVQCPDGHRTHSFLACDARSSCWSRGYGVDVACDAPLTPLPPSFTCSSGVERLPFSLVCDHRQDCSDGSDEDFCVFSECGGVGLMNCGNQQCLPFRLRCDGIEDCASGADEQWCIIGFQQNSSALPCFGLPGRQGVLCRKAPPSHVTSCPEDTFRCHGSYYCLPVYMRCNGVYDCPGREDEADCDSFTCPGYYRCRGSKICLHPSFVCDGLHHCPDRDDEFLCEARCPEECTCYGLSAYCERGFPAPEFPDLRFLEAAGTGMSLSMLSSNPMLVHVGLGRCSLGEMDTPYLPNLRYLDLSDNHLRVVTARDLQKLPNLQTLVLDGNPLTSRFVANVGPSFQFQALEVLCLSGVVIEEFDTGILKPFSSLEILNLSQSSIDVVSDQGFGFLKKLKILDLTGCSLSMFPRDAIRNLGELDMVYSDNYKMCCPATLPKGFHLARCHAPSDEISSCEALLRSDVYRVVLAVFAALALLGNLGSFLYRVVISKVRSNLGYGVFVTHLTVSDFLMGVYLAIIGVADRVYLGTYLWDDVRWTQSAACQVAGFFSLLSSEVSALIICLITLDRVLVLRFPFNQIHFKKKSAHVACAGTWVLGVVLAGVPLLPDTSHWRFYSQNGICIPLPITRKDFPGHDYAFSVMIVFNFLLFVFLAGGQVVIYCSIKQGRLAEGHSTKAANDLAIAQRLITVAVSDFLCWFPIGLLGLLAANGSPIPGEVNVAMAIFVLPLNSALNPFLYTLNMILERRNKEKEKRLQQMILSAQHTTSTNVGRK